MGKQMNRTQIGLYRLARGRELGYTSKGQC